MLNLSFPVQMRWCLEIRAERGDYCDGKEPRWAEDEGGKEGAGEKHSLTG